MNMEEIKKIIRLMEENGLSEFEREDADGRIRLKRAPASPLPAPLTPRAPGEESSPPPPTPPGVKDILSPMVGTFYRSPPGGAEPFVEPGQAVAQDSVVCIIEAMKVMNEVTADCAGEIVEILAEEGSAVEFGQPLFRVRINS